VGIEPTTFRFPPWSDSGIFFKLARWGYTLRVTSQASYSPEYITPTQKNHYLLYIRFSSDIGLLEEMFSFACPKFVTPSAPSYDAAPGKYHRVKDHSRL
jgi:hypothetical protein